MTTRSILTRINDMLVSMESIEEYIANLTVAEFLTNMQTRDAVERRYEILSEASRHIPYELKGRYPEIAWREIAGIGNVLRHDYQQVDPIILYETANRYFPKLRNALNDMAAFLRQSGSS